MQEILRGQRHSLCIRPPFGFNSSPNMSLPRYQDPAQAIDTRIDDLDPRMTLPEKAGQIMQLDGKTWTDVGPVLPTKILSDDYQKLGLTGAFFGLCAQAISGTRQPADFQRFRYIEC